MKNDAPGKKLSPLTLIRALRRRKLHILIPILLVVPAVTFYAERVPKSYRAQALVGSDPVFPGISPVSGKPEVAAALSAQEQLRMVREILLNSEELESLTREFHLRDLPTGHNNGAIIDEVKKKIPIQVEGTSSFYIGFESGDPQEAMLVANRLAEEFVERTSDLRGRRTQRADTFLDSEVENLRRQVAQQEGGVKSYKQSVAQQLPERLATNLKQLETLQQQIQAKTDQITEAESRRSAVTEEMRALEKQGVIDEPPQEKTSSQVALEALRLKLGELKTKYTAEHPEIKRTEREIRDLEAVASAPPPVVHRQPSAAQMRYVGLQGELKSIGPRVASYRQEREALITQMHESERLINSSPGYETVLAERMRDAALIRSRYETLYAKQQEAKLDQRAEKTDNASGFRVIEAAQLPTAPYSPHPERIILLGLLASLAIGFIAMVVAEQLDTSFESGEDLESYTDLPVLTTVPSISGPAPLRKRKGTERLAEAGSMAFTARQMKSFEQGRLTVLTDPQSVAAQQYNILALKVRRWMAHNGGRILLVTSAAGEEGKSVTSVNLSLALANAVEGRVLLVDADLRLPKVHEYLGLSDAPGFGELLEHPDSAIGQYVSRFGNLDVMSGAIRAANPVGLLASRQTRDLLSRFRREYEYVVIDSPPIVPLADSLILAGLADGVVLVVRARKTRPELFRRAAESLSPTNLIGAVLNDVKYADSPYAYAYRYYQRHYVDRA